MAQYTKAISVGFNDNDGGMLFSVNPSCREDIKKLYKRRGKMIGRLLLIREFWLGIKRMETVIDVLKEQDERAIVLNGLDDDRRTV